VGGAEGEIEDAEIEREDATQRGRRQAGGRERESGEELEGKRQCEGERGRASHGKEGWGETPVLGQRPN